MAILELDFSNPDFRSRAGNAWIALQQHPREEGGSLHITLHCASFEELDWQIKQIEKDLKAIRAKARRKFDVAATKPRGPLFPERS